MGSANNEAFEFGEALSLIIRKNIPNPEKVLSQTGLYKSNIEIFLSDDYLSCLNNKKRRFSQHRNRKVRYIIDEESYLTSFHDVNEKYSSIISLYGEETLKEAVRLSTSLDPEDIATMAVSIGSFDYVYTSVAKQLFLADRFVYETARLLAFHKDLEKTLYYFGMIPHGLFRGEITFLTANVEYIELLSISRALYQLSLSLHSLITKQKVINHLMGKKIYHKAIDSLLEQEEYDANSLRLISIKLAREAQFRKLLLSVGISKPFTCSFAILPRRLLCFGSWDSYTLAIFPPEEERKKLSHSGISLTADHVPEALAYTRFLLKEDQDPESGELKKRIFLLNVQSEMAKYNLPEAYKARYRQAIEYLLVLLEIYAYTVGAEEIIYPTSHAIKKKWSTIDHQTARKIYTELPHKMGYNLGCGKLYNNDEKIDFSLRWQKKVDTYHIGMLQREIEEDPKIKILRIKHSLKKNREKKKLLRNRS